MIRKLRFKETAFSFLRQAEARLSTAKTALAKRNYPYCIRQCQEGVELALKASLRYIGIEYPKVHDVSFVLLKSADRFPDWFKAELGRFASISKLLAKEREPAMYGEYDSSPERLFTKTDAQEAIKDAALVLSFTRRLLKVK